MSSRLTHTILAAALVTAAACSDPHTTDTGVATTLHAVIEQPRVQQAEASIFGRNMATRTSIDASVLPHPILWSANDLISIHFNTDVNGGRRVYVLTSGAGTQHAEFTYTQIYDTTDTDVTISADPPTDFTSLFAGYPGEYVTISAQNSELLIEPPREIFLGLDDVDAFPMIGTGGADGSISFVCPFGMICLPVTGSAQIEAIYIDTSDQQAAISGRFSVDPQSYATSFVESVVGSQFSISWNGNSALQLTSTPAYFYAILPAGTYQTGTTFRFLLASGASTVMTTQMPFTVSRAQILNLPAVDVNP